MYLNQSLMTGCLRHTCNFSPPLLLLQPLPQKCGRTVQTFKELDYIPQGTLQSMANFKILFKHLSHFKEVLQNTHILCYSSRRHAHMLSLSSIFPAVILCIPLWPHLLTHFCSPFQGPFFFLTFLTDIFFNFFLDRAIWHSLGLSCSLSLQQSRGLIYSYTKSLWSCT